MMPVGINRVLLVGYLGLDPIVHQTRSGGAACTLVLGTEVQRASGSPRVDWHRVAVWGPLATKCVKNLRRGVEVAVEGALQNREWKHERSQTIRRSTDVRATRITFLGRPGEPTALHTPSPEDQERCDAFAGLAPPLMAPPV